MIFTVSHDELALKEAQAALLAIEIATLREQVNGDAKAPSVREVLRLVGAFSGAICVTEEIARAGRGGIVRVREMAPVVAAINNYLALLPQACEVERS